MSAESLASRPDFLALTKADPDPALRHRAHVLLASLDVLHLHAAATHCEVSYASLHRWWRRVLTDGRGED